MVVPPRRVLPERGSYPDGALRILDFVQSIAGRRVQPSLRDWGFPFGGRPKLESMGYFRASLRDCRNPIGMGEREENSCIRPEVWKAVFGDEVAVGDFGFDWCIFGNKGAVRVAGNLERCLCFAFDALGIVSGAEFFGTIVAIFLQSVELACEPAENVDGGRKFFGAGSELFSDVWLKEKLGELSGCELEADLGELRGVGRAEMFNEVVLEKTGFKSAVLFGAPIAVTATRFPIGNIALGDRDAVFVEGADNSGMGDVVAEHAVNHVANGMGKASDFAVASFWPRGTCRAGLFGVGWRMCCGWFNK